LAIARGFDAGRYSAERIRGSLTVIMLRVRTRIA
jgi:hypothetical protein